MDITIPGWAVIIFSIFGGGLVSWLIWLTVAVFNNREAIAVNSKNDENVTKEFEDINKKIDSLKSDFKEWFTMLNSKLDLYIKNENDFLKDMLKK